MSKKIIFADLDGTLLKKNNHISKKTKKIINILKAKNIEIILISGRPFCATVPIYRSLGLCSLMVSDSGAYISNPSNNFTLIRKAIDYNLFIAFYNDIKNHIEVALYNIEEFVYINNDSNKLDYFSYTPNKDNIFRGDFNNFNTSPSGVLVLVDRLKDPNFKNIMKKYPLLKARYWGIFNEGLLYEIYLESNNKGVAAKLVLDYYQLTKDSALAFGDGINDIELFIEIPGIAMQNAHSELKKYAIDITKNTNKKDGLAKYIKKYLRNFN